MPRHLHLLQKNDLPGEIEIHSDLLSTMPSALSRKRARKAGRERQDPMKDAGTANCLLCHPSRVKPPGTSQQEWLIRDRVASFVNDFPYLPGDQLVIYLSHPEDKAREQLLHHVELKDVGRRELYWLVTGCIARGKLYQTPDRTYDLMRMVAGFNFGKLAGQSIPHVHMQYGWEIVLDRRTISEMELALYFDELAYCDLVIHQDDRVKVVAPWTPKGQFALELYFNNKFEICELDELDVKLLATFGHRIVQKYLELGIQNLNIVFANSPKDRKIEPLVAHFVPRVNMTALYEIKGVNVVDTPPQKIVEEFRRHGPNEEGVINWVELRRQAELYDPSTEFRNDLAKLGISET
jgi:galactose-1-phosphate uridylyltransferase